MDYSGVPAWPPPCSRSLPAADRYFRACGNQLATGRARRGRTGHGSRRSMAIPGWRSSNCCMTSRSRSRRGSVVSTLVALTGDIGLSRYHSKRRRKRMSEVVVLLESSSAFRGRWPVPTAAGVCPGGCRDPAQCAVHGTPLRIFVVHFGKMSAQCGQALVRVEISQFNEMNGPVRIDKFTKELRPVLSCIS
jgi:hypothetical protein